MAAPASADDAWTRADIVLINATAYDFAMIESIARLAEGMRAGAVLALTTHRLPGRLFELLAEDTVDASWGDVTLRLYRRLKLPKWVAGIVGRRAVAPVAHRDA